MFACTKSIMCSYPYCDERTNVSIYYIHAYVCVYVDENLPGSPNVIVNLTVIK